MHYLLKLFLTFMIVFSALFVSVVQAEGILSSLWESGCAFLFDTDNVTVTGEADFQLDGVRFKSAKLNYVQEGSKSYYNLQLFTPRDEGGERENGWIIIADGNGNLVVMERYYPGIYKKGTGFPHSTLLRHSVELDALTDLGGLLVEQLEPMLPESAVVVTDLEDGKIIRVTLNASGIPSIAVSALNVAAGYLSDRWFSYGHDRNLEDYKPAFEDYYTITQALTDGTICWALNAADVEFAMDQDDRLTAAKGMVRASSVFLDESVREVEVSFNFKMTDYGVSRVADFDPFVYQVEMQEGSFNPDGEDYEISMEDDAWEECRNQAEKILQAQGFPITPEKGWGGWLSGGRIFLSIDGPDDEYLCIFSEDGSLLAMRHRMIPWMNADQKGIDELDTSILEDAENKICAFLTEINPDAAEQIKPEPQSIMTSDDGIRYVIFHDAAKRNAQFIVQIEPSLRIESYSEEFAE